MVDPSSLADTVTPPSFSPAADVTAPLKGWSAACAADARVTAAAEVRRRPANLASVLPVESVMKVLPWVVRPAHDQEFATLHRPALGSSPTAGSKASLCQ